MGLRELRKSRNMTQKDLAQMCGINFRSLQDYEQGHKKLTSANGDILLRLSTVLGCSTTELLLDGDINGAALLPTNYVEVETIQRQQFYCDKYKTAGRWVCANDTVSTMFYYQGQKYTVPFHAVFTPVMLPCLKDAAILQTEEIIIMKVLMLNGSPKANGNTAMALKEAQTEFEKQGIQVELVHVGNQPVRGCMACMGCFQKGKCVFDDIVNELAPKLEACDGLIIASPVYYAAANATLVAVLDRLFYSTRFDKTMKVGASVAVARRGGCSATFDQLNKYFTISNMPIASSQYWNSVHGGMPGQTAEDLEGLQTMRTLAKNMTFLMKSIALGKEQFGLPEKEPPAFTSFVR